MPKIISIPSRKIEAEFPDSMPDEEIKSILQQKYPRTGDDVAYDVSQFSNIADTRDFIAKMPVNEYVMLNNYSADKKLSWGELAGVAGEAIGTIVGDVVKGAGATVTKAGDGVAESALRGVAAGTVDLVSLGHKLVTPNVRIPTFNEFVAKTPITTRLVDSPQKQGATGLTYAWPSEEVSATTEDDYKQFINQQRQMELQSLDIADISEKLIQGAPVPEVAKGFSYLDAVTLAGLAKSVARSGVKSIYKAVAKQPLKAATGVVPDIAAKGTPILDVVSGELRGANIPANMMRNAEQFATKVGEGARKAGLTGVQLGAGTVKGAADLGKGVIDIANKLGLESAAIRGTLGGAIGYQEGGTAGAIAGTIAGAAVPKLIRGTLSGVSRTADFIGAAAKVAKTGPSRTGIFEKMAQAANISPGARGIAEKVLFTQPFVQYASEAAKQAAKNALLGAGVGAALGYAADGEEGAAAGFGSGFAVGGMTGVFDASYDAMKSIAGRSTARSQRNAAGDINSFVNDITDDQARSDYGEIMNRAIQIAGPERAADMLDSLRLAEGMGANVKVDNKAFNSFAYDGTNGGTITINPDRMNAGSVGHEVFHQLFNVGVRGELQAALSDVYLPKKDANGNIIQNGLFDDKEFAKKASELAEKYKDNPRGYKDALEAASVLDNPAGFSPEAVDNARAFVIDEMTASYTEKFMGRSRTGVFNPDRLPMWHRQILENIDDKILNNINDKVFANKSVKDPTAFFTDAEGKPVRVPQLDNVLNRAFKSKLGRDRSAVGKPREVVAPKNPRERALWAAATFGATRDVLDPIDQRLLTEKERKVITAADFDAAKALYQSLPDEEKQTVRVTKKSGVATDINSKGARIEITSQTPSNVFESFLQVAKDRGMGNQQLANMRQLYASMALDDGPTFDTVNNPVYEYNPKTGKMTPGVRPASRQEVYPTAITVNSAGGFNVEYIDLSRVKANAEKILKNPEYKGVWNGLDDFMTDFGSSLRNLSKGEAAAMPSAELLGKGNAKVGAMKRDLIAEAMNVTLPKRLQGEGKGYINQPTIDPLTLATKEGKDRRTEGSAFRDFRIERLTNVTPTNNRLKMVKEDAYDILVRRFQPSAFTPETLPNGEAFTNPDGYRILNKAGSKLFRTYDDTGKLIGIAESKEKAMKKAQDEFAKKAMKEEPDTSKSPTEMRFQADEDYRGTHKAPTGEFGEGSLDAMNKTYPDDIYSAQGWRFYGDGASLMDKEAHRVITSLKGKPDATVTVYRSIPKGTAKQINPNDWVTTVKGYAKMHGERFDGGMDILSKKVKASELFTEGNSIFEFGWSPKKEMRFQPVTPEQDAAFLSAAKAGDMETAQRLRSFAVKQTEDLIRATEQALKAEFYKVAEEKGGNSPEAEAAYEKYMPFRQKLRNAEEDTLYPNQTRISLGPIIEEFQNKYSDSFDESRKRWDKRGEKVSDNENLGGVFKATGSGVLFRGISIDDFNRIKKTGFIDTDFRAAISNQEGLNLTPDVRTAAAYLPNNSDGLIIAINTDGLDLYNIGADSYIRSFDKIPVEKIVSATAPVFKSAEGTYYTQNKGPITYDNAGNIIPLSQRFNQASPDIRFQPISERELSTRWDSYPKTRGELTKPKILSALKGSRNPPVSRDKLAKFVMTYDNPQDLMDHTYYHGTGNFISETVKPSITMSDRQAEQMGGGGYGEKYWAISLSKSKRVSETFAGQSRSVRVHPVLLKKSAKVIELPGIEDAAQLEDHIIDLWKNQVDAVWIGGGEQELAVINPRALVFAKDADTYQVFGGYKSENLTLEKAQEVMNQAAEVISNPESTIKIRFQPDPTSPNILNGSDGSRIIKSTSGKYRVYLATGALAGIKDTLESAQKLVQAKSKSYAPN